MEKNSNRAKEEGIDVTVKYNPVPAGQKRNIGADVAKGSIIAFTDDDTILREDWIRNGVKHLCKNEKYIGILLIILKKTHRLRISGNHKLHNI